MYPFLHNSYRALVNLDVLVIANFHPLNLIVTKFFLTTFSDNLFFLRLGSMLAMVLYLVYAWRLARYCFGSPWLSGLAFILLNFNPFLYEFWALSRGYGMAIAFMTASIFYVLRYLQSRSALHLVISFLFALVAVYSNFSLLYYYTGLIAVAGACTILYAEKKRRECSPSCPWSQALPQSCTCWWPRLYNGSWSITAFVTADTKAFTGTQCEHSSRKACA